MKHLLQLTAVLAFALAAAPVPAQDGASEEDTEDSTEEEQAAQEAAPEDVEVVMVTGTRLATGDPTAQVGFITEEEIAGRGFSNVEDIVRSLPQNFSTINSTNNLDGGSPLDTGLGALGLGISTANLRGLGSGNTLVLKNGRKMAGAAGNSQHFVNLRDIPASSVERIEVYLDGGSAVYGADAIGGVINIITKKGYGGASLKASNEQSAHGADIARYSAYLGTDWGAGNVSLNASWQESNPYDSRKAGFNTKDHRDKYGGDERADLNFVRQRGQVYARGYKYPVVSTSRWGPFNLTLGDHDGRGATVDDFREVTLADARLDNIPLDAGGATEDTSVSVDLEHTFFDTVRVFGELSRNSADTVSRRSTLGVNSYTIPATNAFNPFGQAVYVKYDPQTEIDAGLLAIPNQTSATTQTRTVLGFDYFFGENSQATLAWVNSLSEQQNVQYTFATSTARGLASLTDNQADQRIQEILASSDPDVAANFFGDGTAQNPTIAELLVPFGGSDEYTELTSIDGHISTTLAGLPGGRIGLVAGFEVETRERHDRSVYQGQTNEEFFRGVAKPTRDFSAYFMEVSLPIVGVDNARPWMQSLTLTLQARRDNYSTEGAAGATPVDPSDPFGPKNPNLKKVEYGHTSPRIGLAWQPAGNLKVRTSWTESFKPPAFNHLFSTTEREYKNTTLYDPLGPRVQGVYEVGPNPDLKPEVSVNLTIGVEWTPEFVPGLVLDANFTTIEIQDRIAYSHELAQLLPAEVYGNLTEFFVRDDNGTLIRQIGRPVNISLRGREELGIVVLYSYDAGRFGMFLPSISYTRVLDQYDKAVDGGGKVRFLGESIGVDEYSLQGRVEWLVNDRWTVSGFLDFTPSYLNTTHSKSGSPFVDELPPDKRVDSYTTVDLSAKYLFREGLAFRAGGRNVFDAEYPYILASGGQPYDTKRVDLRGRVWFAEVSYDVGWW